MKAVKRWKYYCDHCKRSGGSKHHLSRHELACTNNPERICRVCDDAKPFAALLAAADEGVDALRAAAERCPACMLTGARAWLHRARTEQYPDLCESATSVELAEWDYAAERNAWWLNKFPDDALRY